MLQNYLRSAWRNFHKNTLHATINIFGLAVGMAACILIFLMVRHEFSYDRHHPDRERIYHVSSRIEIGGGEWISNRGVSGPVPAAMREEFTGLETVAAFYTEHLAVKDAQGQDLGEEEVLVAGPDYFQVFGGYQWQAGNPRQSLSAPYQVVLTESQARLYFGDQEPLGQILLYKDSIPFTVSGILADVTVPTSFKFTQFLSSATLITNEAFGQNFGLTSWDGTTSSSLAFLTLAPGVQPAQIEAQFPDFIRKHISPEDGTDPTELRAFELHPLADVHFNAELGIGRTAHKPTLYGLIAIALFMLMLAVINFVNLETARAVLRAREVGVRKTLGSSRAQLISQFLGETFLLTLVAGLLAVGLVQYSLDYFADSLPPDLSLSMLFASGTWLVLLLFLGLVSLLAGFYPALVLSGYAPAFALKNQAFAQGTTSRKTYLRKSLIVFQFAVSQVFIIGTLIVGSQMRFMLQQDMGFRADALIHFSAPHWWEDTTDRRFTLAEELRRLPEVSSLTLGTLPSFYGWSSNTATFQSDSAEVEISLYRKMSDTAYLRTYEIPLLAGRNLHASDTVAEVVLNETAARAFGFAQPGDIVGQTIQINQRPVPVVGVVRDFHDSPLRDKIKPIMLGMEKSSLNTFGLRFHSRGKSGDEVQRLLQQVETRFKAFYPDAPFEYAFYDDTITNFYKTERRTARTVNAATLLAVFISCLGLFGLISFTTHQRTKEIGIRKVLGASVTNIMLLFSREFVGLVLAAFVVAAPLAWYFGRDWLDQFAYRISIGPGIFVVTALAALAIALFTVSLQTWRAALANPVDSLRSE
ncbi:duplicated orphan permease [Catalinimonas alkaloidigena]|uniref:Duplicated orphan permease n=1 Tax=Catalinimonas alkaloidigena TaxID=1075417 RepID=A0A1G8X5N4_9BACT|nr:ABC transporter permease [Catalinimonas alkaloidigena]SDJ85938.1 duplicated orphan permease [Catalinimonas alkaloidigena]